MRAHRVPRRRRQAGAGPRVTGLGIAQEGRDAAGQQIGRLGHVGRPPPPGRHHDLVPALGRRDAGAGGGDVGHRLVAAVADPGEDGLRRPAHGARHHLGLERSQVGTRSPAPDHGDDVTVASAEHLEGAGDRGGGAGTLHGRLDQGDAEAEPGARELAHEVLEPLGPGAGDQTDVHRQVGHAQRGVTPEQTLGLELAQQLGSLCGHAPEEGGDIDLGEDEADLALGSIQVERAPQDDDHSLGELDALLGEVVAQRRPRTAPALDLERGLAAPGSLPGRGLVAGVHQVHVEVARPVVGQMLDLAAHPQRSVPG